MARTRKAVVATTETSNIIDENIEKQDTFEDVIADNMVSDKPQNTIIINNPQPTLEEKKEWVFNPNEKTSVRNITNIGISVILENTVGKRGEVFIPAKQARPISNEEIIIKIEAQNPSFCGTDGLGANASLYIEDKGFREYLDFETISAKQSILSDSILEEIFTEEKISLFKELIQKNVKTYAEKDKLISYLCDKYNSGSFDSISKIDFVESYTGLKIK